MYTKFNTKKETQKPPTNDEEVEKFLCNGSTTGNATFGIYKIFRKQNPEMSILEVLEKTLNHVVKIIS